MQSLLGTSLMAFLLYCLGCSIGAGDTHHPGKAISNLDVYPGLEATLFASEPMLANPTNIGIDHSGRIWVCDVVNYREHARESHHPEGDRILILEDTDGDGVADSS